MDRIALQSRERAVTAHELSRLDARRIAVRAQPLDRLRLAGLLDMVHQLTLLQIDPAAVTSILCWTRRLVAGSSEAVVCKNGTSVSFGPIPINSTRKV
jgi:hypothetical protein